MFLTPSMANSTQFTMPIDLHHFILTQGLAQGKLFHFQSSELLVLVKIGSEGALLYGEAPVYVMLIYLQSTFEEIHLTGSNIPFQCMVQCGCLIKWGYK